MYISYIFQILPDFVFQVDVPGDGVCQVCSEVSFHVGYLYKHKHMDIRIFLWY